MTRKRNLAKLPADATNQFREFRFDCELTVAVNPLTYTEITLTPPVKIKSYEDFAKFNEQWAKFCADLGGSPTEVCFTMT